MLKYGILIGAFLCFFQNSFSQDKMFENKTATIAKRIDSITSTEKAAMQKALGRIDKKVENNQLSADEAETQKQEVASYHAQRINEGVSNQQQKLQDLIQKKVNGKLTSQEEKKWSDNTFMDFDEENLELDSITGLKIEKRFTTQFVIALGANNPTSSGGTYYGNGFKTSAFGFGEVGFSFKYRLKEDSNLWNLKFGFSVIAQELKPDNDNDVFVMTHDGLTTLQDAGFPIKKSKLNIGYLTLPVHFEIDLSKPKYDRNSNQSYLRSQQGFRIGLGGFFGVRYYTNQVVRYDENGKKVRKVERDDFNTNSFTFGPSAYIGYHDISLFARYDANPLFKNNPVDINNLSFGIRFDFN